MRAGAGLLISFALLAVVAGYSQQESGKFRMMLSSNGDASGQGAADAAVATKAAAIGAKLAVLAGSVGDIWPATSPEKTVTSPKSPPYSQSVSLG